MNEREASTSPLANSKEVAAYLGVSTKTLASWRCRRFGPVWTSVNHRTVRYRWSDVERWYDDQRKAA